MLLPLDPEPPGLTFSADAGVPRVRESCQPGSSHPPGVHRDPAPMGHRLPTDSPHKAATQHGQSPAGSGDLPSGMNSTSQVQCPRPRTLYSFPVFTTQARHLLCQGPQEPWLLHPDGPPSSPPWGPGLWLLPTPASGTFGSAARRDPRTATPTRHAGPPHEARGSRSPCNPLLDQLCPQATEQLRAG